MTSTKESKFLEEYKILGHIKETQKIASVTGRWSHHISQKTVTFTVLQ